MTVCICSTVLLTAASTSTPPQGHPPLIPFPVQPHSGCQCLSLWEQQRGIWSLSGHRAHSLCATCPRSTHSIFQPGSCNQQFVQLFFHSQELLLIIPASKGPFPSEPAVGSLNTALSAAERHRLGCSFSFLSSVPRGMDADKHGLDAWKPSRWFQCLSLSCCWDGESTMVLGSRSQHSDFTSFGETASPGECSEADAQ